MSTARIGDAARRLLARSTKDWRSSRPRTRYRPPWHERVRRAIAAAPERRVFPGARRHHARGTRGASCGAGRSHRRRRALLVLSLGLIPANEIGVERREPARHAARCRRASSRSWSFASTEFRASTARRSSCRRCSAASDAVREALEHIEVQFLANRDPHLHFAMLTRLHGRAARDEARRRRDPRGGRVTASTRSTRSTARGERCCSISSTVRVVERAAKACGWAGSESAASSRSSTGSSAAARAMRSRASSGTSHRCVDVRVRHHARLRHGAAARCGADARRARWRIRSTGRCSTHERGRVVARATESSSRVSASRSRARTARASRRFTRATPASIRTRPPSPTSIRICSREGSYTGKGIYDVDAFERATHGRFPENTLLSHDLIEGAFARAGLVTDIELYDDYPTRYLTYTRRKHRWIRGDWQILRWIGGRVPGPARRPEPNRLSAISRWKIFDNLRRSTVEIFQLLLLVAGWTLLPARQWRGQAACSLAIAVPWLLNLTLAAVRPPADKSLFAYYASVWRDAVTSAQQLALTIIALPHQAYVSARCDRAHARAAVGDEAPPARVADGIADRAGRRRAHCARCGGACCPRRS